MPPDLKIAPPENYFYPIETKRKKSSITKTQLIIKVFQCGKMKFVHVIDLWTSSEEEKSSSSSSACVRFSKRSAQLSEEKFLMKLIKWNETKGRRMGKEGSFCCLAWIILNHVRWDYVNQGQITDWCRSFFSWFQAKIISKLKQTPKF